MKVSDAATFHYHKKQSWKERPKQIADYVRFLLREKMGKNIKVSDHYLKLIPYQSDPALLHPHFDNSKTIDREG